MKIFLTLVLDEGKWSASRPRCLTPKERAPGTHCIGGCVGSGGDLDSMEKGKHFNPVGNRTSSNADCTIPDLIKTRIVNNIARMAVFTLMVKKEIKVPS
jgi:hypothetical protein